MDRETQKITTPGGKEVVMKIYLTARERNEARQVVFSKFKFNLEKGSAATSDVSAAILDEGNYKLLEIAVVSYDGVADKPLEKILDCDASEYDFILAEAVKIKGGNFLAAK
jgi:hypothetical protein